MKLFIVNKPDFEREVKSSHEAHSNAFKTLSEHVSELKIPIEIYADFSTNHDHEICVLEFTSRKEIKGEDVYFYKYIYTIGG